MSKAALFLAAILAGAPLGAHEKGMMDPAKTAVTQVEKTAKGVVKDAKAVASDAANAVKGAVNQAEAVVQVVPMERLKETATSHMHNKLVHFPLALGLFGCLFFIAAIKWPQLMLAARILLASAVVIGYAAVRAGRGQAEEFLGTSMHDTLRMHSQIARNSLWFLVAVLLLSYFPSFKKWSWVVAVLAMAGLLLAGGLGGVLASSEI